LAGLVIIPLLTVGGVGYHCYQQTRPPTKVILLVADFDGPELQKYRNKFLELSDGPYWRQQAEEQLKALGQGNGPHLSLGSAGGQRMRRGPGHLKHEWHERRRKTRKGVSRFSHPFVNFVFRWSQPTQRVQRFKGLAEEEILAVEVQSDARAS